MLIIRDASMKIKRLLDCADTYADDAALFQGTEPDTAMIYAKVAEQLLASIMEIHGAVVKSINKFKAANTEPISPNMEQMWASEHKYLIDKHSMISNKLKMIKSM